MSFYGVEFGVLSVHLYRCGFLGLLGETGSALSGYVGFCIALASLWWTHIPLGKKLDGLLRFCHCSSGAIVGVISKCLLVRH